jgi:hypothetical protein
VTTFDDRERAFENQFAHDEEVRFRIRARRNRAVAHWASAKLGKDGAIAMAYADDIVAEGVSGSDDAMLAQRIANDLAAAGQSVQVADVRAEMDRLLTVAMQQERSA